MSPAQISLGFAVPSGDPVLIPIGHMAVVGQTQVAGKTTTLEACAWRVPDDFAVLAFVTKRGEGGFTNGVLDVPPYFRERADWEYVSSILEATLRERMKFERGWIMRACKGAQSLKDVHRNVKTLMATAKGLSADIYYQLDHYLDKIIPQVLTLGPARSLTLARTAVNVMDLSKFSGEMQGLIIASCLETAYRSFQKTIIVIPEAWEFLPRARKSPVTYAAELYIRKGGALANYLWIDSQDLAGVHTPVLKQVQIWLLGVQREINEVKRTLAHIHGVKKPKVDAVAGLGLGQFIACVGQQAITTYVQPPWVTAQIAQEHAQGIIPHTPRRLPTTGKPIGFTGFKTAEQHQEDLVDEKLKAENDQLRQRNGELLGEIEQLRERLAKLEKASTEFLAARTRPFTIPTEEAPTRRAGTTPLHGRSLDENGAVAFTPVPIAPSDGGLPLDWLQQVREKILQDAEVQVALLKISVQRPEIVVEITPRAVAMDASTPRGRLAKMIAHGLLDQPVKPGVILKEFERTGGNVHPSRLSEYLADFVQMGMVTREEGNLYMKVPGIKITTRELQVTA